MSLLTELEKCESALVTGRALLESLLDAPDSAYLPSLSSLGQNGQLFMDTVWKVLTKTLSKPSVSHLKERDTIIATDDDIELLLKISENGNLHVSVPPVSKHTNDASSNGLQSDIVPNGELPVSASRTESNSEDVVGKALVPETSQNDVNGLESNAPENGNNERLNGTSNMDVTAEGIDDLSCNIPVVNGVFSPIRQNKVSNSEGKLKVGVTRSASAAKTVDPIPSNTATRTSLRLNAASQSKKRSKSEENDLSKSPSKNLVTPSAKPPRHVSSSSSSDDSDCQITGFEQMPLSPQRPPVMLKQPKSENTVPHSSKLNKSKSPFQSNRKRRLSSSSEVSFDVVLTSLPKDRWAKLTKDPRLSQDAIVPVTKINNLPPNQASFSRKELADLGIAAIGNASRTSRRGSNPDIDEEFQNLLRAPRLLVPTRATGLATTANAAVRSMRTATRRVSSSLSSHSNEGSRRPSISDSEEEHIDKASAQSRDPYRFDPSADEMDEHNSDGEFVIDEDEEDVEEEQCGDPDFKPKNPNKKLSAKPGKNETPDDVQRLLRKRIGASARNSDGSTKDENSRSKSTADSDEVVVRRRPSQRPENTNDDSDSELSDDESEESDSDFEPCPKKKRSMPARKAACKKKSTKEDDASDDDDDGDDDFDEDDDFDDDDDDDEEFVTKKKQNKRVTRSNKKSAKKTPSKIVVLDDGSTNPSEGGENKAEGKKRRRRIKRNSELELSTRHALKEEMERQRRIAERQKMYNEATNVTPTEWHEAVVLEVDPASNKPVLQVNPEIARKLKKHQAEVVKFMWQTCCESLELLRNPSQPGSGCIVAHCMGLGKTLSVICFVHTLIANRDITGVKNCLILSPLNTVLNWTAEFSRWVPENDEIDVREISSIKQMKARAAQLSGWQRDGGVLILGYEMYRRLTQDYKPNKTSPRKPNVFHDALLSPGPDIIICDEGHILKSSASAISKLANLVRTRRRIVLTGTPLQNNLFEYHCMVSFVKPSLLGTKDEFANRFANPIRMGESKDSTAADERLMKRRICVLHRLLSGCVHRRGYEHLSDVLPIKLEYVLLLRLTKIQADLYMKYLTDIVGVKSTLKISESEAHAFRRRLFADYHTLRYVATHPYLLLAAKLKRDEKEERAEMRDFMDVADRHEASTASDESEEEPEASSGSVELVDGNSSDSSDVILIGPDGEELQKAPKEKVPKKEPVASTSKGRRVTRSNPSKQQTDADEIATSIAESARFDWFTSLVTEDMAKSIEVSSKFMILMQFIRAFESVGDKTLIFSQSLFFLDLLEEVLNAEQQRRQSEENPDPDLITTWQPDLDYFRIDGQVGASIRSDLIKRFNSPTNMRARLFLISTRAGGLGINLVGANRVIITDVSWNPSNDLQALFRAYRFGQTKPVYVYRLVAAGTMEERIYDRQVLKQSLSQRVVDEQQILRHFSVRDIAELYQFDWNDNTVTDPPPESRADSQPESELLPLADADGTFSQNQENAPRVNQESDFSRFIVPKDRIFAEVLRKFPHVVKAYHDHDSLLAHQEDQVLDESERTAAWREYENEQKGIRVDSDNPLHSHQQLTRAYQRDYRLTEDVAAYHALCYLRDQFAPLRTVVREYVEKYMPYFEQKARESQLNSEKEKQIQQQWAEMQQAQLLAAGATGSNVVAVANQEEFIRNLMAQAQPMAARPPPAFLNQLRQHSTMAAIRQFAPYERDVRNVQPAPLPAGLAMATPQQAAASRLLSSLMVPAQAQSKPGLARKVVPAANKPSKQPSKQGNIPIQAAAPVQSPSQPQPQQIQPQNLSNQSQKNNAQPAP